ncbi:MAG: hypothetical protein L6Q92_04735 [Phycisphaerae bacterium]|nr:hypothetical protein [Phycisphaerae bacterium]
MSIERSSPGTFVIQTLVVLALLIAQNLGVMTSNAMMSWTAMILLLVFFFALIYDAFLGSRRAARRKVLAVGLAWFLFNGTYPPQQIALPSPRERGAEREDEGRGAAPATGPSAVAHAESEAPPTPKPTTFPSISAATGPTTAPVVRIARDENAIERVFSEVVGALDNLLGEPRIAVYEIRGAVDVNVRLLVINWLIVEAFVLAMWLGLRTRAVPLAPLNSDGSESVGPTPPAGGS